MVSWEINHDQEKIFQHFLVSDFYNYVSSKLNFFLIVLRTFKFLKMRIEFIEPNLLRVSGLFWHLLEYRVLKDIPVLLTVNTLVECSEHAKHNVLAFNDLVVSIHPLQSFYLKHC